MGKYNNVDKAYFSEKELFSELISVGVYHKRVQMKAEDLEALELTYPSLAGSSGELERDGLFQCNGHGVKYGLEIENHADYGMPRRILVEDACEYEREQRQIVKRHEKEKDYKNFEERKSGSFLWRCNAGTTRKSCINCLNRKNFKILQQRRRG